MKNEKEEKEAIEALKDAVNGEVGKAVKHLFLAGYYHGINYHSIEDAEVEKAHLEEMGIGNIYEIEEVVE